jgi:hypothetical protein
MVSSEGDVAVPAKPRKERDPNWSRIEMLALVRAKRAEFIEELEADDPRQLMNPEMSKWEKFPFQ